MIVKVLWEMLLDLPDELVLVIESRLQRKDIVNWYNAQNKILTYKTMIPHILQELSQWKIQKRKKCAQCNHDAITCIVWSANYKRDWIPWCCVHSNPFILNEIDVYCIGSLDVNGISLLDDSIE